MDIASSDATLYAYFVIAGFAGSIIVITALSAFGVAFRAVISIFR